jgi:ABC-type phosphate/phosphonate transport system substrate-binding protein
MRRQATDSCRIRSDRPVPSACGVVRSSLHLRSRHFFSNSGARTASNRLYEENDDALAGSFPAAAASEQLRRLIQWSILALLAHAAICFNALRAADAPTAQDEPLAPVRFSFSSSMFVDVNENDAKASMKVLAQTMGTERGIPVDSTIELYTGPEAIKKALQSELTDAITLPTSEYWLIRHDAPFGSLILGVKDGKSTEEYLLLVHRDSGIEKLGDLRGKSVIFFKSPRTSIAAQWAETLLLQGGLGRASTFWRQITSEAKLSRAVLPLFFRQVDACITTRDGYALMVDLNPQVGRQLKILATSPTVVPAAFFFRENYVSAYRSKLIQECSRIHETVAGRQVLMLFQSSSLQERPLSDLDSAMELLELHKRLCDEADRAEKERLPKDVIKEDVK